jgi:hypothetical protein
MLSKRSLLLQMGEPSDNIMYGMANKPSLISLGKFGSFPARHLLDLTYDITYEIIPNTSPKEDAPGMEAGPEHRTEGGMGFGQMRGKKRKKGKGGNGEEGENRKKGEGRTNPGWANTLRVLKRATLVDAVVGTYTYRAARVGLADGCR